jgi:hypothetical protein
MPAERGTILRSCFQTKALSEAVLWYVSGALVSLTYGKPVSSEIQTTQPGETYFLAGLYIFDITFECHLIFRDEFCISGSRHCYEPQQPEVEVVREGGGNKGVETVFVQGPDKLLRLSLF